MLPKSMLPKSMLPKSMLPKSMLPKSMLPGQMHREMTPGRKRLLKKGAGAENFQMRSISSGFCWEPELGPIQSGGRPGGRLRLCRLDWCGLA